MIQTVATTPAVPTAERRAALASLAQLSNVLDCAWASTPTGSGVETFDAELEGVHQAWQAAQAAVSRALAAFRFERNKTVGVNRLPAEILLDIFQYAHDDHRTLLRITHTCAYWREVLIHDSEAWARTNCSALPKKIADIFAERSVNRPLDFSYTMSYHDPPYITENLWPYQLWRRQMHRVQRLTLAIHPQSTTGVPPITSWLANSRTPFLEEVELSLVEAPYSAMKEDYVCADIHVDIPKLRSLSLSGVRFPWSAGLYNRLTKLHIQLWGTFDLPNATGESILSVFRDQPVLEDLLLHIKCIMHSTSMPSSFVDGPFLSLPALKKVQLALTPQDMTFVLSAISLPADLPWLCLSSISWPLLDIARCLPTDPRCLANLRDVSICKVEWRKCEVEFAKPSNTTKDDAEPEYVARMDIADASMDYVDVIFSTVDKVRSLHDLDRLSWFVLADLPDNSAVNSSTARVLRKVVTPTLKRLDLLNCSGDVLGLLSAALGDRSLEWLRLTGMTVDVTTLSQLCSAEQPKFERLRLRDCVVLGENAAKVMKALRTVQTFCKDTCFENISFLTRDGLTVPTLN